MPIATKPTPKMMLGGLLGVILAVVVMSLLTGLFKGTPQPNPAQIALPRPPEEVAKPHLDVADKACERAIDDSVKALDNFFADSKKNTRAFAEEALSLGSKWRLMVDHVPYTRGGRHEKFIREKFGEYVFTPDKLGDVVKQIVSNYLAQVRSIEGRMLVDIRADVADFPSAYLLAQLDEKTLRETYDQAIAHAIKATYSAVPAAIADVIVTTIAGEVLTQVALQLGVSAGILGTGAGSSWATLGVGLVAGLIVDEIVTWVWDWYADPKGSLAVKLDGKLDEIHRLIVDGSKNVQGLRARLRQFARERANVRRTVVLTLLQPQQRQAQ